MLNLVWKDVVAVRRLLPLVVVLGGAQIAVMSFQPPVYVIAALIFSGLLGLGSVWVEEYQGTELLWNSLPVTRGQFVTARYLTTLIGIAAGLAFSWALAQSAARMASGVAGGPAALISIEAHAVMLGLLLLAAAIFLPLHFRFGAGRALMYFLALAIVAVMVFSLVTRRALADMGYAASTPDPQAWRALIARVVAWSEPQIAQLLSLFVGAAALAMCTSLLISRRVYETRDL